MNPSELQGATASIADEWQVVRKLGEYVIIDHIQDGGMGSVYAAWHPGLDRVFALKLPKTDCVASAEGLVGFRTEVRTLAALDHPNITRVYAGGVWEKQPYLAMELLSGGSLESEENAKAFRSARAAHGLLLKLARAVQYAQARGVLHCDLKPSNILFDDDGEPRISDFGLSRVLRPNLASHTRGGTPGWMAPEQMPLGADNEEPRLLPLTLATDVFGLGMLLYWVLHGQLPASFDAANTGPTKHKPLSPGPFRPHLRWALEAVYCKALQPEPQLRYASAAELVIELRLIATGYPQTGTAIPLWGKLWLAARRHPVAALTSCAVFWLLLLGGLIAERTSASHEQRLRDSVLDMNAYAAHGQAAVVLYQLREQRDALLGAASDSRLREIEPVLSPSHASNLVNPTPGVVVCDAEGVPRGNQLLAGIAHDFDVLQFLDTSGCPRGRFPPGPDDYGKRWYGWRDYFQGAAQLGVAGRVAVHVGDTIRSSVSGEIRFSLSTPVYNSESPPTPSARRWTGVLAAGKTVSGVFTIPALRQAQSPDRITALLGTFEGPTRVSFDLPQDYTFLAHPSLERGAEQRLELRYSSELRRAFGARGPSLDEFTLSEVAPYAVAGYTDPFLGGRWLTAFAPVGGTGYVVLVQSREEAAIRPSAALTRQLLYALASLGLFALSFCAALVVWGRREMKDRA